MESMEIFRQKVHKPQINYTSPLYSRKIIRKFSPYITRFLVTKTNVSANQVTILQLVFSLMGLGLLCFPDIRIALFGSLLLHIGFVFDCIDGEVARYRKTQSINGMFLDFVNHEIIIPMTYACLAFHYFFVFFSIPFFLIAVIIIILKNNPIGKARQTTINFLVEKRKSPSYDIKNYSNSPNLTTSTKEVRSENDNVENESKQTHFSKLSFLKKLRNRVKALLEYPNDIIIVSGIIIIELLSGNDLTGKIFLLALASYLSINFIFDLWWHLRKKIAERDFFIVLNACDEINQASYKIDN